MVSEPRILKFFLGTNSPIGFVSRFDEITNAETLDSVFALKGGPGSGKSTLMKKVAEAALPYSDEIEYIHCASDLESLDAVIVPGLRCAVADATPPHPIEPKYPGAFEQIVALGDCWDTKKLATDRDKIIALSDGISQLHRQAGRYLAAASALMSDNARTAAQFTDMKKVQKTAARIAGHTFKSRHREGTERIRFLSTVTDKGYYTFHETAKTLADSITLLEDDYGVSAPALLDHLRRAALEAGYDIVTCYSPLAPLERIEHLFIPALSLGFMTKNRFVLPEVIPDRVINARRFTDAEGLSAYKKRMAFNRRAAAQMLTHAEAAVAEAKARHDLLEAYYAAAMDYKKLDAMGKKVVASFIK